MLLDLQAGQHTWAHPDRGILYGTLTLTVAVRPQGCAVRRELAELLDVLLDLQQANAPGAPGAALAGALTGALPALLAGYGATLSTGDRALLRALRAVDARLRVAGAGPAAQPAGDGGALEGAGEDGEGSAEVADEGAPAAEVAAVFGGPLAAAGCEPASLPLMRTCCISSMVVLLWTGTELPAASPPC